MKKIQQLSPLKMDNFFMKTTKRSVVIGQICNQQESSSLTMAPTISKEKSTPTTIEMPVKIKKEKSQTKEYTNGRILVTYKWLRKIEGKLFLVSPVPQVYGACEVIFRKYRWFSRGNVQETCQISCQ